MRIRKYNLYEVLSAVPDAVLVVDRGGRIAFANELAAQMFDYTPETLLQSAVESLAPKRLRRSHTQDWRDFMACPRPLPMGARRDLIALRRSGAEFPVEVSLNPLGSGDELQMICVVRDVSAQRAREEGFRETVKELERDVASSDAVARRSEDNLRLFVEHAPAAVAMFDRHMRYLVVSRRWLDGYGLGDRDIIGQSHYDVFPDIPDTWKQAHRRCLAGEVLSCEEDSFVRGDGQREWLRWELHPWRDAEGDIGGMILFSEVITGWKRTEQALLKNREELEDRVTERTRDLQAAKDEALRANALKSRFVAGASHDLRQPLQASIAYLSALERQLEHDDHRRTCAQARQPLEAMSGILDVLLDISRLESGSIKPDPRDFRIDDLLDRAVTGHRLEADRKGLRLSVLPSGLLAHSDPQLLERMVDNLVSNAVRYTEAGAVELGAVPSGGALQIFVRDTGMGIPPDALDQIFEEYIQLDNPARDRRKGLGLGLSMTKYLADILGHRIEVRSVVGRGSTFTIETPLGVMAAPDQPFSPDKRTAPGPTRRPVALLVDDDPAVLSAMMMVLELDDIESHGAHGGEEALKMVAAGLRPDIIVSDYRLPGYNGIEAIRRLRQAIGATPPALLLTGDTLVKRVDPGELADCTVLHKPFDTERLAQLIKSLAHETPPDLA
jgi:PAS domain S-box-containing protein